MWPLVALVAFASPVHGQEVTATISGYVVNGTAGADTPGDVQVLLHVLRTDGQQDIRTAELDSAGRVVFEDVPREGVAGYALMATYLGIGYAVDVTPEDDLSNVRLTVYEATSTLDNVSIASNSMLVLGEEGATRTLSFMELIQVVNDGDRVFLPDGSQDGPMNLLRFPLPPDAANLEVESELPEGQVLQVDRGFALTTPVPPGEYGVAFTYTVPYVGTRLDISRSFLGGAGTFRVMVPGGVGTVSSVAMTDLGDTTIGETTYHVLELRGLSSGSLVDIILEGLSQPSLWQRMKEVSNTLSWMAVVLVALLLALASLLVVGLRKTEVPELAAAGDNGLGQTSLAQAIAALDDQFQQGELVETAYQEQRRALKAHLLRLARQEETRT